MAKNVAELFVEVLAAAGVKRIYGVAGDSLNGITDSVRTRTGMEWVGVRHEESAAFAAGAEAALTGKLAVCAGSCGPGNLHLINGLYDCQRSRVPVLAIAAHIPSREIGSGYFQETHPELLFKECSHYCELVSHPAQMPRTLEIAIQTALSKRGVAVVVLPGDVALSDAVNPGRRVTFTTQQPEVTPGREQLEKLAAELNGAQRVTILAGAGCAGAHDQLLAIAGKLQSPIVHAMRGKEFIEYDNPYDVGMTGLLGFASGYKAMMNCDTLLMLGTDFPYQQFYPQNARIVQVDLREEQLGRRSHVDLGVVGGVAETLRAVLPLVEQKQSRAHLDAALADYREARKGLADPSAIPGQSVERSGLGRRHLHGRRGDAGDLGGALSQNEWPPPAAQFVQSRLHGQRAAAGSRRADFASRPPGGCALRRRRRLDAYGRSALTAATESAGEDRRLQQRIAGLCGTGDEGDRLPDPRDGSGESGLLQDRRRRGHPGSARG